MTDDESRPESGDDTQETLDELRARLEKYEQGWPPGHFYSPIPNLNDIAINEERVFAPPPKSLPAIDLAEDHQEEMLGVIESFYPEHPFRPSPSQDCRYYYDNDYYGIGDAIVLLGFMRHAEPARILEIGAGFSTAAMLDIDDRFLGGRVEFTIIEPYPDRLLELLSDRDLDRIELRQQRVQETNISEFAKLSSGDILFVDSSHVVKTDSDLTHLLFRFMPALEAGVLIHFHDIFYPFEYPVEWIYQGRAWNECYVLRAFLQYNKDFEIVCFNSQVGLVHGDRVERSMPLFAGSPGSSLWLRKRSGSIR